MAIAVSRIGRRVACWDALRDRYLWRLHQYLEYTIYLGIEVVFVHDANAKFIVLL